MEHSRPTSESSTTVDERGHEEPAEGRSPSVDPHESGTSAPSIDLLLVGTLGGGGIHQHVVNLERQLDERYNTTIHDMQSEPTGSGIWWAFRSFIRSILAFLRFIVRRRPDIIHVHTSQSISFYRAAAYVLFVAYIWRRPVLVHVHGSGFDRFIESASAPTRLVQSSVFTAADGIIVLSEYWREVIEPVSEDTPVYVVPNAVDPDAYSPEFDRQYPLVTFVSTLVERKGVHELLDTIDDLSASLSASFDAAIAGTGPLSDDVESTARELGSLEYLGYVPEEEKRALLDQSTIFVLPTYAEGLPIAVLEGMAGGNAVVSTAVGGIPEVIDEEGGIVVDPGDEQAFHQAVRELIVSPSDAEAMGRYNRRQIEQQFSWDAVLDRLQAIYVNTIDGEDGPDVEMPPEGPTQPAEVS